jgi:P4 family phage/plasmid primase-like protien
MAKGAGVILPSNAARVRGSPLADAARKLIGLGIYPVPVPYREKAPILNGWPELRIAKPEVPKYFNGKKSNIGVLLGIDGLADIDLDAPETLVIADAFLPASDFTFGRDSKPRSHRFYRLEKGIPTVKFIDPVRRDVLLELRCLKHDLAIGLQTVVPPSTHPSGERIRFAATPGKPVQVDADSLSTATRQLAATALLARHWPAEGQRNEGFLALAGTFAQASLPQNLAVKVAQGIYNVLWGGAANVNQAEREVEQTYSKHTNGQATTGYTRLTEFLPETVIRHALVWLGVQAPTGATKDFPYTDLGNAERLAARHGEDLRWVDAWHGWLAWDGRRWARDESQRGMALAQETVRSIYGQAAAVADPDVRKALVDHARRSESRQKLDSMIALARPMLAVTPQRFDSNPWLLNVENGTIDLQTGELREHRREDYLTKLAPVAYDPTQKCPRWKKFLEEVFALHPDLLPFIQKFVGYSLTGDTREECFALLYGTGRNGKGTFLKTIQGFLGDYAGTADFSAFVSARYNGPRDDVANMQGRRFVAAQESREGAALAESLIKWLTGGDRVRARRLYENSTEFDPTAKLWLATNHRPIVRGTDPAIWSRIKLIPFEVSFEGREDKTLKQELVKEAPGILAWAVRGCLRWQKEGLKFPESVVKATQEYRSDSDQVGRFIAERCVLEGKCKALLLYQGYQGWCSSMGEEALTANAFGRRLTERGLVKWYTNQGMMYRGITMRELE